MGGVGYFQSGESGTCLDLKLNLSCPELEQADNDFSIWRIQMFHHIFTMLKGGQKLSHNDGESKYAHSWSLRLYHKMWDISEMFNAINEVAEYNIQSALKKQCLNSRCKFNQTP